MRKRANKARRLEPGRDLGGEVVAPVRFHRADPLALPRIDAKTGEPSDNPMEVAMAFDWLDAGYLDDSMTDWSAKRLVKAGFERWAGKWLGETPNLSPIYLCYSVEGDRNEENDWLFTIELDSAETVRVLEPRYFEIESKAPDLFETALDAIERTASRLATPGTPAAIRDQATFALWNGFDNEDDWRAEMACFGLSDEEINERLSPGMYDAEIPAWVRNAQPQLNRTALRKLAKSPDAEVAEIAKCVLRLNELRKDIEPFQMDEQWPLYPLALLRWSDRDEVLRCFDDIVHEANCCGDGWTSQITVQDVQRTTEGFRAWRERMQKSFAVLAITNKLIGLMSIPDESLN